MNYSFLRGKQKAGNLFSKKVRKEIVEKLCLFIGKSLTFAALEASYIYPKNKLTSIDLANEKRNCSTSDWPGC